MLQCRHKALGSIFSSVSSNVMTTEVSHTCNYNCLLTVFFCCWHTNLEAQIYITVSQITLQTAKLL